jgi:nucleoside phosphorylase
LIFQVYGAPTITDLSFILKDGGVEEIIFIGLAYGLKNGLKIGSYVIPNIVQASEGLLKQIFNADYSSPNNEIVGNVKKVFDNKNIEYDEGKTISVPCTFFHLDYKKFDIDVIAAEMEFSSICYISEKIGLKCGGILIISDNKDHSLLDDRTEFYRRWVECFKVVKESLE